MSLPAVVEPTPQSLAQIDDQCSMIESWAAACPSVPDLQEAAGRLAAIDLYLSRTTIEGRARVAAAMRRLEVRIGQLSESPHADFLHRQRGREFQTMAQHVDVVDEVIDASDDEHPPTRRKVLAAIGSVSDPRSVRKRERQEQIAAFEVDGVSPEEMARRLDVSVSTVRNDRRELGLVRLDKSRQGVMIRRAQVAELAARGLTSAQIAKKVGVSAHWVRKAAIAEGVQIVADKHVTKAYSIDANRVVERTVLGLDAQASALTLMDGHWPEVDRSQVDEWVSSLTQSLRSLNRFREQLKELTHDRP